MVEYLLTLLSFYVNYHGTSCTNCALSIKNNRQLCLCVIISILTRIAQFDHNVSPLQQSKGWSFRM